MYERRVCAWFPRRPGEESVSDPLKLELQAVMSYLMWLLGMDSGFFTSVAVLLTTEHLFSPLSSSWKACIWYLSLLDFKYIMFCTHSSQKTI